MAFIFSFVFVSHTESCKESITYFVQDCLLRPAKEDESLREERLVAGGYSWYEIQSNHIELRLSDFGLDAHGRSFAFVMFLYLRLVMKEEDLR